MVWWFVCVSVGRSETFLKEWPLEYQMINKTYLRPTYLPTYLCDSSDGSDNSDSSESIDTSDSSDTSESSYKKYQNKIVI